MHPENSANVEYNLHNKLIFTISAIKITLLFYQDYLGNTIALHFDVIVPVQ